MDPPTVPGRSGWLYIGYPEEGGAIFCPGNPLSGPASDEDARPPALMRVDRREKPHTTGNQA